MASKSKGQSEWCDHEWIYVIPGKFRLRLVTYFFSVYILQANDKEALILVKSKLEPDESGLSIVPVDLNSHRNFDDHENSLSVLSQRIGNDKILALAPVEFHMSASNGENVGGSTAIVPLGAERLIPRRNIIPVETPTEMMTRWKTENLDLKTVVKDALFSGRLPLAVLQLHLHRLGDLVGEKERNDYFIEVRDIGRAIAYDLLLKVLW